MKKKSRTATVFGSVFNVRTWVDFDRMKTFTTYLSTGFRKMFIPQESGSGESFKEAMDRLNLNEKDLQSRQTALLRLSLFMCVAAIFIFAYGLYHLLTGGYRATIISFAVMLIALALAFRYHFWYFQIKERKLGCTLKDWYRKGLMGGK